MIEVARKWRETVFMVGLQWVLSVVAVLLVLRGRSMDPMACALLLIAACPVGDIANFYTLVARGNLPLALAINALVCSTDGMAYWPWDGPSR